MTKDEFITIMTSKQEGDDTSETSSTISLLNKYCNVTIGMEIKGDDCTYSYIADADELINSHITEDDLSSVRNNGWFFDRNKNIIFKNI